MPIRFGSSAEKSLSVTLAILFLRPVNNPILFPPRPLLSEDYADVRGCVRVELHAIHLNLRQTTVDTTMGHKTQEERRSAEQNPPRVLSPDCSVDEPAVPSDLGRSNCRVAYRTGDCSVESTVGRSMRSVDDGRPKRTEPTHVSGRRVPSAEVTQCPFAVST